VVTALIGGVVGALLVIAVNEINDRIRLKRYREETRRMYPRGENNGQS
jgi:hypothetical protein